MTASGRPACAGTALGDRRRRRGDDGPFLRGDRVWWVATDDLALDYMVRERIEDAR